MGINRDDLIGKIKNAETIAKRIDEERHNAKSRDKLNKITQIRLFYDELQKLQKDAKKLDFKLLVPSIYLVMSKVAYSHGRKLIGEELRKFLQNNIGGIETKEDLDNFMLYFEAVLGYYRYFNPSES
ncbi:MAG: type III-A CRISPR-associated protein Csm2 [Deferribacteraceae bacterium]|jgi:CRISPR-associated protein Csm2|nr:type III-A CRISPR-associated protein Csm2 [Deferribacteraceae bacterium]